MSSLLQRRCAHDGCRSAATPSSAYCPSHQQPAVIQAPARTNGPPHRQRDEFAVSVMLRQDLDRLAEDALDDITMELGAIRDLTREIGILRFLLERTVSGSLVDGDPKALAKDAVPLIAEIGRALRTAEQIKDGNRDIIAEAIKKTLIEHGKSLKL